MSVDTRDATADSSHAILVEPMPDMGPAYHAFLEEFVRAGEEGLLHNLPEGMEDTVEFIHRLKNHSEGFSPPDEPVPCSAYWLLSENKTLVGEIHIRHRLTPALEDYGGNIGYMVRPSERGKGYATKMLGLALNKARAMGMVRIMLTCEPENIASARVIEKNGGRLISGPAAGRGCVTSRYWIDLS